VTILFVAGVGRSGSTILGNLLGQIDGFLSVGELRYLGERGVRDGDPCGCGLPVPECSLWKEVIARTATAGAGDAMRTLVDEQQSVTRLRHSPVLVHDRGRGYPWLRRRAPHWLDHVGAVARAVGEVSGAEVVVDTSKLPSYGAALEATGVDMRVIHLVRDPRGVACSCSAERGRQDRAAQGSMNRQPALTAALLWTGWNEVARKLWARQSGRYTVLNYEHLVAAPEEAINDALKAVGLPDARLDLTPGNGPVVPCHTVAGNPVRMNSGPITLRPDLAWQQAMSPSVQRAVTAVTAVTARRLRTHSAPLAEVRH
jgi:hypothetical protein